MFKSDEQIYKNVLESLKTSENLVEEEVETLQEWIQTQNHFPEIMDRRITKSLLLLNKCNTEQTKKKIETYYKIRLDLNELYKKMNPNLLSMQNVVNFVYVVLHPEIVQRTERVCFVKIRDLTLTSKIDVYDVLRLAINIFELRLRYDQTCGGIFIVDCTGISLSVVLKITPAFVYTSLQVLEKVFSSRLNGVYILNLPRIARPVLYILKKFMKAKLYQRIRICESYDELKDFFDEDFLPTDFGGKGLSLEQLQDLMKKEFRKNQKLFDYLDTLNCSDKLLQLKT